MRLNFKEIEIENFLSIGKAKVNLCNMGYTMVNGVNKNPVDFAKSNGAGKSSIFEAISWCLTGETIRGVKDVVNMYTKGGTAVTLKFTVNGEENYVISRYKEHSKFKTDLKIEVNGKDVSGKGIRDSQKILETYLPDLTSSLVGSVILLGQGLPQRFTNNTPSGRKEVLEKLSKSDFMIEDLKNRISARKSTLTKLIREKEDKILADNSRQSILENQIQRNTMQLENMPEESVYDDLIKSITENIEDKAKAITEKQTQVEAHTVEIESLIQMQANAEKSIREEITEDTMQYLKAKAKVDEQVSALKAEINSINREITKLKSVKDVCPTCGRKLEGVVKPDTKPLEDNLALKEQSLKTLTDRLNRMGEEHKEAQQELNTMLVGATGDYPEKIAQSRKLKTELQTTVGELEREINKLKTQLLDSQQKKNQYNYTKTTLTQQIDENTKEIENIKQDIVYNSVDKEELNDRSLVINKFNTIISRDFRGYLLKNVIKYINDRAKEYCVDMFNNDNIDFELNGNNIDIMYCGKQYESCSGGERQKVDLIIQFSIRDMLCQFLGFSSNILALDEIFDALDSTGCDKVIEMIAKKLSDIDSVFIITHRGELGIPADNYITVTKDSTGVSNIIC